MKNKPPVYECVLIASEQETSLMLKSATKEFCRLIGLQQVFVEQPIEKTVPKKTAEWLYQAFYYIKDGNESIHNLREIRGTFWSYSLTYNKPVLTIMMVPIWDAEKSSRTYQMDNAANLPLNKFFNCYHDSILVECTNNNYYVLSISPTLAQLTEVAIGDPIEKLFSSMRCIRTDQILRHTMAQNKVSYFMDIYVRNDRCYYLLLTLVPLSHSERYLLISIHSLKANEYYQMMKSTTQNSDYICESGNIGVAVFETSNSKYKKLVSANQCFNRLVYSQEDFDFLRAKVIPLCCKKQSIVTLSHRLGNLDCLIAAIPTPKSNQLFLFAMPSTGPQRSIQSLADRLTKREFEIACHVANGNSIKGISADCGITEGTVKKNLSNIYNKLKISNRVELVRLFFSATTSL